MSAANPWVDVMFVFANGTTGPGQAVDVGEGWCDCIDTADDSATIRFWAPSDGSTNSLSHVRLMQPFAFYAAAALDQKKRLTE